MNFSTERLTFLRGNSENDLRFEQDNDGIRKFPVQKPHTTQKFSETR